MPFTTGSNALRYRLTSIQLYLSRVSESPLVYISIREDNAGLPGESTLARLNMSTAITADANIPQLITFTTSGEVTLQPDTLYWLHIDASTTAGPAGVQQTASDDEDTPSHAGWSIGDHRVSRIDGGAWTTPTSRCLQPANEDTRANARHIAHDRYQRCYLLTSPPPHAWP